MTKDELQNLDNELAQGYISNDEYLERLRSEVMHLHQDLSEVDVLNMFQMQLRIMAVDDVISNDMHSERFSVDVPSKESKTGEKTKEDVHEKEAEACAAEMQKSSEKAENPGKGSSSAKSQGKEAKSDFSASQASGGQEDSSQKPNPSDSGDGSKKEDENDRQKKQQDKDSKSKSSSHWWWTWQIVPDWSEWSFEKNEEKAKEEDKPISIEADDIVDNSSIESKYVIDMTQKPDGTYSI